MKIGSIIGVLSLMSLTAFGAEKGGVGIVDLQKVIPATSAGKKAKTEMENEAQKRRKPIEAKETELIKASEELEKKRTVLSEEAFIQKKRELEEDMMKHGANKRKYLEDMQAKERELIVPILEKARKILAKLTKEKGISVVIENTPMVLFASPEVDLTNDLIKAFESEK